MERWQCSMCGHVYDEAEGDPEQGVAPGTPWGDVPDGYQCPDCGAAKFDYFLVED